MKYTGSDIDVVYAQNLRIAEAQLSSLPVARGRRPSFQGLNGWVFEQTIQACLADELELLGVGVEMREQAKLAGRAKVDLLISDHIAIEIKAGGIFGDDHVRYGKYLQQAKALGWKYLYITRQESHSPYRDATIKVFGHKYAFFLDQGQDWERFVTVVVVNLGVNSARPFSTIGRLFLQEPKQWGYRGDPYLWRELACMLASSPLPADVTALEAAIGSAFEAATGRSIHAQDEFSCERFAHGGMSSGMISPEFWQDDALPLLRSYYALEQQQLRKPPRF